MRWLHLSDFHFEADVRWGQQETLRALLRWAAEQRQLDRGPDLVFLTGDVARSGKREEYGQAEEFLARLADATGLDPHKQFFVVPGNHDVDRSAIGPADAAITRSLRDQNAINAVLRDPPTMRLLGRRLDEFYAFTERLLGPARRLNPDRPWRVDLREVAGTQVAILQLNSAWASGTDEDAGRLLVGVEQVVEALETAAAAAVRIGLVHHPLTDLADIDRAGVRNRLRGKGGVQALLSGHVHEGDLVGTSGPRGQIAEISAGTVYTGEKWPRGFNQTALDFEAGVLRACFFAYSDVGLHWAPDSLAIEGHPDGTWEMPLPASLRTGSKAAEKAVVAATGKRRQSLAARYRAAVAAVHGTVRFVGFADSRPRRNVQVPELFVPLHVRDGERGAADEKAPTWTTSELLTRLVGRGEEPARLLVLGDPGSGKTTLCRFLAVVLAGETPIEGVVVSGEPLPLFLPFRDYIRRQHEIGDCDLLTFLAEQAKNHLQFSLTVEDITAALEAALEAGAAVLLLDGLDEFGAAADRENARERVQAFCRAWRVPVLVTSRVAGYDEAPLPDGPGGFRKLRLEPFDDSDLELFVVRWYSAQEPEDPKARDEGIANLRATLASDERVRELARNPMLATLIALVHRFEAHLPGERAKLYDLCVKTLLETWPAARRRRFHDIDEGLQRAYLEELAYALQQKRSDARGEVTVERAELVALLTGVVARDRGIQEEVARGVVERWVTFLEEGTGLLVEQRPGVFAFLHLSLMEYLAARGWDRAGGLVEGIAARFADHVWREVCLLAIGSRATDRVFLDRLFDLLTQPDEVTSGASSFLLSALAEEAAFDEGQCERIAAAAARTMLEDWWSDQWARFGRVRRLSRRHRDWVERWLATAVTVRRGEELIGVVLLAGRDDRGTVELLGRDDRGTVELLGRRADAPEAAADLLDLAPAGGVGRWALGAVPPAGVERFLSATPEELVPLRALFALTAGPIAWPRPATARVVSSALRLAALAEEAVAALASRRRPGGRGLPARVTASPGALEVTPLVFLAGATATLVSKANVQAAPLARFFARFFARDLASDFASNLASDFALDFASGFANDFALVLAGDIISDFTRSFARGFARDFARFFARDFASDLASFFVRRHASDFALVFGSDLARDFALDFAEEPSTLGLRRRVAPPPAPPEAVDLVARPWRREREPSREELERYLPLLYARQAADAWVALASTVERPAEEKVAYLGRRLQNAWLLHTWRILDHHLDRDPHPDRLALYLALGWSQATTTWLWPGTPRWIEILGGPPPAEWRPRATWHLCWLLHDSERPKHLAGLRGALAEGRAEDPEDLLIAALEDASGLSAVD